MEKDTEKQTGLNLYNLSLFKNDPYSAFLFRKSQSLAAALYLITDYFPAEEPLKWNVRERANFLLQCSISFAFAIKEERKNITNSIISASIEILSLSEIGSLTKLISEMNFNVLKKEFENLLDAIEKERETFNLGINFVLDQSTFNPKDSITSSWPKGTNKGQRTIKDKMVSPLSARGFKGRNFIKDNKSDRKNLIINLLKTQSDLSIKDISQAFPDCSEKTIQRELNQMTQNGILKKTGERRWSRYSLVIH